MTHPAATPFSPETVLSPDQASISIDTSPLPEIPGGWTTRMVTVAGRAFPMALPASPDAFLEDPRVLEAHQRDGYMPYWGYLWPTSLEMATAVLEHRWPAGTRALEIGAGIGLSGLAGLAAGLEVVFSDYDAQAVELALFNARMNGLDRARGLVLDWRSPPAERYPVIFGCDVIYERQNHAPILNLLDIMLADQGEAWFADPGRHQADAFLADARQQGYDCLCRPLPRQAFAGRPDGVTNLWILRRRGERD
jgi:predicted nicotinamide N-methyase